MTDAMIIVLLMWFGALILLLESFENKFEPWFGWSGVIVVFSSLVFYNLEVFPEKLFSTLVIFFTPEKDVLLFLGAAIPVSSGYFYWLLSRRKEKQKKIDKLISKIESRLSEYENKNIEKKHESKLYVLSYRIAKLESKQSAEVARLAFVDIFFILLLFFICYANFYNRNIDFNFFSFQINWVWYFIAVYSLYSLIWQFVYASFFKIKLFEFRKTKVKSKYLKIN